VLTAGTNAMYKHAKQNILENWSRTIYVRKPGGERRLLLWVTHLSMLVWHL